VVEVTAIDGETLDIFERTARGVLAQPDIDVGAALEEIGWRDFLAADPASVVPLMFELLGELVLASCALDDVAFAALGTTGEELSATSHAFAHPRGAGTAAARSAGEVMVDALVLGGRRDLPVALVADERVVTIAAGRLEWSTAAGIDPHLGLARVRGSVANGDIEVHDDLDGGAVAPACRRALAHELLGATDAMLAVATEYAKARQQFGQPIGAFQAVKHRLADVYVARQAASAVIGESWRSDPECTTLAAKALAATAGARASENCLQVLGAIGFTLEHDLHRYIRRVRVLDRLYGTERDLRTEIGLLLRARGRVPRPGVA
jgi:Acyl-CoA dehydrogenase, C-terminal domain